MDTVTEQATGQTTSIERYKRNTIDIVRKERIEKLLSHETINEGDIVQFCEETRRIWDKTPDIELCADIPGTVSEQALMGIVLSGGMAWGILKDAVAPFQWYVDLAKEVAQREGPEYLERYTPGILKDRDAATQAIEIVTAKFRSNLDASESTPK